MGTHISIEIDTFDEMAGSIRETAAAMRAADAVGSQRDAAIMYDFAQQAIAKAEEALNAWAEANKIGEADDARQP